MSSARLKMVGRSRASKAQCATMLYLMIRLDEKREIYLILVPAPQFLLSLRYDYSDLLTNFPRESVDSAGSEV